MAEEKKRTLNEGKIVSDENAENSIDNNVMASKIDDDTMVLPMIPLRGMNVFPNMVLHFDIGREKSINALEKAMIMDKYIFLAAQKDETTDLPSTQPLYTVLLRCVEDTRTKRHSSFSRFLPINADAALPAPDMVPIVPSGSPL